MFSKKSALSQKSPTSKKNFQANTISDFGLLQFKQTSDGVQHRDLLKAIFKFANPNTKTMFFTYGIKPSSRLTAQAVENHLST